MQEVRLTGDQFLESWVDHVRLVAGRRRLGSHCRLRLTQLGCWLALVKDLSLANMPWVELASYPCQASDPQALSSSQEAGQALLVYTHLDTALYHTGQKLAGLTSPW